MATPNIHEMMALVTIPLSLIHIFVIHPYLILNEEIELDRETALRGFHVAHHQCEIGIDLRTLAQDVYKRQDLWR